MHLKSYPKVVRSELRLDLGQQQGALLRRSLHSNRLPLSELSTNTLRCSNNVSATRAKGSENSAVFSEDDTAPLDVWSVIKPGHVREKIALFAPDGLSDRNAKGTWEVSSKRRRRTSQIQPQTLQIQSQIQPQTLQIQSQIQTLQSQPQIQPQTLQPQTLQIQPQTHQIQPQTLQIQPQTLQIQPQTLQTQSQSVLKPPPGDPPEDEAKLSVVEMVAFLEQRVNCEPHAKLRSSASITLSRAPPLSPPAPPSPDRPIAAEGEEPESVSVSDMVAKLESLCLRRRTQGERRTVGRVLLAASEQNHALLTSRQPISNTEKFKATPTSSIGTTKTLISFCKSDLKVTTKAKPTISSESRETSKTSTTTQATPTSVERCNVIGRGKNKSTPTSQTKEAKSKAVLICKSEKTPQAKSTHKCDVKEIQQSAAKVCCDVIAKVETETSTHCDVTAANKSEKTEEETENSVKLLESPSYEEPMPGLLFLTPPSKFSLQSEWRKPLSPAPLSIPNSDSFLVLSDFAVPSETRKTEQSPSNSSNSDSLVVLSLDLTVQSQTRTHCSFSLSPASSSEFKSKILDSLDSDSLTVSDVSGQSVKRKRRSCSVSPASNSDPTQSPIKTLQSNTISFSETHSACSANDFNVQSSKRKSCPVPNSDLDSSVQSEKTRSCRVGKPDALLSRTSLDFIVKPQTLSSNSDVQSETSTSSLDHANESEKSDSLFLETSLDLCVQSEKRKPCVDLSSSSVDLVLSSSKSCPAPRSDSLDFEFSILSEKNKAFLVNNSHLLDSALENQLEKRRSFPATDSCDSSNSELSVQSETKGSDPVLSRSSSDVGSVLLRSSSDVGAHSDRRRRRKAVRALSLCSAVAPGRYRAASEDFLLMRQRVQRLLEPRSQVSYLSLLPHHLLVHILLLLPTRALAALKCTGHYFRLIIDTYDVRPADSLWVCDPRYRDDPCKQCKRRYRRGDVSLCRWHHKPFCQALPYGPGYWMCCHGDRRDAPGCNVGLHDNRWVPAFHSINAPIYRGRQRDTGPGRQEEH